MRKNRVIIDGGIYHITNKINEEKMLLKPNEIKKLFMRVLYTAKFIKKYRFKVKNILIMNNHIHLIIKIEQGENLSRVMQWIFSVFAMRYNKLYGRKGHLWISRFWSKVIETIKAYQKIFEYVCNNPVDAGIVADASEYCFGIDKLSKHKIFGKLFSLESEY